MKKNVTHQHFGAWVSLVIFTIGWSMGVVHQLALHHDHGNRRECTDLSSSGASHIHDESYANEHCSLCAFVLSTPELLSVSPAIQNSISAVGGQDSFPDIDVFHPVLNDTSSPRGPPVM